MNDINTIDASAFESIETLFISLNESIDSSTSGSTNYDTVQQNSLGESNYTRDPDYFSDDEFFVSSQNPNFEANIKIEPQDENLTFTPRIVRRHSTPSPSQSTRSKSNKNEKGSRKLSTSPFDDIKLGGNESEV